MKLKENFELRDRDLAGSGFQPGCPTRAGTFGVFRASSVRGRAPAVTAGVEAMTIRFYKIALTVSLVLNVLMVTGFWYYRSIEDLLGIVEMAVGFMN